MSTVRCEPAVFELSAPGEGELMLPIKRKNYFPVMILLQSRFKQLADSYNNFLCFRICFNDLLKLFSAQ